MLVICGNARSSLIATGERFRNCSTCSKECFNSYLFAIYIACSSFLAHREFIPSSILMNLLTIHNQVDDKFGTDSRDCFCSNYSASIFFEISARRSSRLKIIVTAKPTSAHSYTYETDFSSGCLPREKQVAHDEADDLRNGLGRIKLPRRAVSALYRHRCPRLV